MFWDIFVVIIIVVGTIFIVEELALLFSEICISSSYPRIPFETFKRLYYINPNKWDIGYKDYVKYTKEESKYSYSYEKFKFTLWDYFRYQNFRKIINKKAKKKLHLAQKEAQQKRLEECTKLWIKDIEAFAAENEKRMKAAKIENEEIIKRILGERA